MEAAVLRKVLGQPVMAKLHRGEENLDFNITLSSGLYLTSENHTHDMWTISYVYILILTYIK